jgi:zinc protease
MRHLLTVPLLLAVSCGGSKKPVDPLADVVLHDPSVARTMPAPLPERPFTTPKTERRKLSNGLEVVVATNTEVPLVTLTLALRAGDYAAPKPGMASAAFAMLDKGAGDLDAAAIARQLKGLASDLGAGAGDDGASVSLSSLRRNLEPTLDLFTKVVLDPTFPAEEWKLLQMQYVGAIRNARKDPTAIARRVQDRAFHGDAYRGRIPVEADYEALTPDDMKAWYKATVGPQNGIILVGGAITADEVVPMLEARLGAWKPEGVATPALPPPAAAPTADAVWFVDKPGAAQTVLQAMRVVGERTEPDWYPFNLGIDVLGGTFMSRLNMNLREDKGYTYGARCGTATRFGPSILSCSASVQTAVTGPSIVEMRKELTEILAARPITEDELAYMKSTRINQYPARFETPGALLGEQDAIWRYGLPEDWPERYLPAVEAVDVAGASAALQKRLTTGGTIWLVVGDKATIFPAVQEMGLPIVEIDADGRPVPPPAPPAPAPKPRGKK